MLVDVSTYLLEFDQPLAEVVEFEMSPCDRVRILLSLVAEVNPFEVVGVDHVHV